MRAVFMTFSIAVYGMLNMLFAHGWNRVGRTLRCSFFCIFEMSSCVLETPKSS